MKRIRQIVVLLFLFAGLFGTALAETVESGKNQLQMIELFTSEGCSSCPPADRWLTSLIEEPGLWTEFVPIAFHVDYWNGLGWPDPFSKEEYSDRQRIYQSQGNIATVYTPGIVIQGEEWRSWFGSFDRPPKSNKEVGNLAIALDEKQARVAFEPRDPIRSGVLHFAWLGFGYDRRIGRGENGGKTLREDFVVLNLQQSPVELQENQFSADFDLPVRDSGNGHKLALVAWFSAEDNQRPIQAVGAWFAGGSLSQSSSAPF
ncbi:MAG: DUF1223 domain-containing protein [Gammaproteobacteria bacterium]